MDEKEFLDDPISENGDAEKEVTSKNVLRP